MESNTDPRRRLALQLALQLPADVAEARQVLALTHEVLDDFLIAPTTAQARARRLGWGVVVSTDRPRLDAEKPRPALALSMGWALASLTISTPIAAVMMYLFGVGAGLTYMTGVTLVALVFGRTPALVVAALSPVMHNLFVVQPSLVFNAPTTVEVICALAYLLMAVMVPSIAARRGRIRGAALRMVKEIERPIARRRAG